MLRMHCLVFLITTFSLSLYAFVNEEGGAFKNESVNYITYIDANKDIFTLKVSAKNVGDRISVDVSLVNSNVDVSEFSYNIIADQLILRVKAGPFAESIASFELSLYEGKLSSSFFHGFDRWNLDLMAEMSYEELYKVLFYRPYKSPVYASGEILYAETIIPRLLKLDSRRFLVDLVKTLPELVTQEGRPTTANKGLIQQSLINGVAQTLREPKTMNLGIIALNHIFDYLHFNASVEDRVNIDYRPVLNELHEHSAMGDMKVLLVKMFVVQLYELNHLATPEGWDASRARKELDFLLELAHKIRLDVEPSLRTKLYLKAQIAKLSWRLRGVDRSIRDDIKRLGGSFGTLHIGGTHIGNTEAGLFKNARVSHRESIELKKFNEKAVPLAPSTELRCVILF